MIIIVVHMRNALIDNVVESRHECTTETNR